MIEKRNRKIHLTPMSASAASLLSLLTEKRKYSRSMYGDPRETATSKRPGSARMTQAPSDRCEFTH